MSEDQPDAPDPQAKARLDRQRAEGAAGDLARMGIDPRSLGLGDPAGAGAPPAAAAASTDPDPDTAEVVELRPGTTQVAPPPVDPAPVPTGPTPYQQARALEPATTRQTSRLIRTVATGLITPDAAVVAQGERELLESIRQRQTERRVVAFLSGKGGVGCTSVAVAVGTIFSALREDASVVVDVQAGTGSLGALFGADEPRSVTWLLRETGVTAPPTSPAGLGLLDGVDWDRTLTRTDLSGVLDRLGDEHAFHLLDGGNDVGEGAYAALARADQVVLVTGPGEVGALAEDVVRRRVRDINPAALATLVAVEVDPFGASRSEPRGLRIPADPWLRQGHPFDPERVDPGTRLALLRVAAAIAIGSRVG